ncbi:glutathione S-transferase family protein [Aquisalimonas lutea]|uniref:glutathione S-transferase family protein n=1 Tax=Aquisalimonas lutea TaxID=1327750 RepID=UPI0025B48397|nr:glutathione S-transferase family protein [Aquisalimonas lutea]MDN3517693.1 glutathione S-transferase family protein [Aquisalimonas lutea]
MQIYYSLTSPYARIVRMAIHEKGLGAQVEHHVVNPWDDDPGLMQVNPLTRVPTLVTDDGTTLTEATLITQYLERRHPDRALLPKGADSRVLGEAGIAVGIIDAAVHKLLGRKAAGEAFDDSPLGQRRDRAIRQALDRMEARLPGAMPELGAIAAVVALDYLDFRFPELAWAEDRPQLGAWHDALRTRPSVKDTAPVDA